MKSTVNSLRVTSQNTANGRPGTFRKLAGAIALLLASGNVMAKDEGHYISNRFIDVEEAIALAVEKHGAKNVLIALDIDNTAMKLERDLGSEHWFMWQSKLIEQYKETHVVPEGMVATSIPDLLNLQTTLTNLSPMMPVELRIPSSLQKFVERGSSAIALTSRSPSMGDKTRFELERAGFPYRKVNFETSTDWALEHQPYNLEDIETSGLSKDDVIEFSLKTPRDVVFKNGVYLTQGQHKGIMLKTLMHKMKRKYNAIVFVDDRAHHLEGMQNAFKTSDLAVTTVQYIHERDAIERFNNSSKEAVKAVWCEVSQGLIEFKREHEGLGFLPCAN